MPATTTRELVVSAAALGLPSGPADRVLKLAAVELRIALDSGLPRTHSRCQALLMLISNARRHLIPRKERAAPRADGLSRSTDEVAAEIDKAATATANAIGLSDAEPLRRNAFGIVKAARRAAANNGTTPTDDAGTDASAAKKKAITTSKAGLQKRAGPRKIRILPRAALSSVQAIVELARSDPNLGHAVQIRKQDLAKSSMDRRRRVSRTRRGRRAMESDAMRMAGNNLVPDFNAPVQTRYQAQHGGMTANTANANIAGSLHQPQQQHHLPHVSPMQMQPAFQMPHVPFMSHHMLQNVHNLHQRYTTQHAAAQFHNLSNPNLNATATTTSATSAAAPTNLTTTTNSQAPKPSQKDDPEAFVAHAIRTVLLERERQVLRKLSERRAELLSLPLGVSEDVRRKAIIESKQMKLLETQRRVRSKLCVEMKKSWSPSYQEMGVVPNDNLSRLFRRQQLVYTYTDGYPRTSPYDDNIPALPNRDKEKVHTDSRNLAIFDRRRMMMHKGYKKQMHAQKLNHHVQSFENYYSYAHQARTKICRGVLKYFHDKARAEEKRKKQEQVERLRLLRSNDETAYFNLLKSTKNERLLQLVRQTDNYLMQIGAQVERVREQKDAVAPDEPNVFNQELEESQQAHQSIDAMRSRRDMYYTVTHSVQEEVEQPSILVHGKLKPYQMEGLKWLVSLYNNGLNGILADEMGLGKTIQTIALLTYLIQVKKNPGPYLVVVPLSVVGNWVREMNLWAPSVKKIVYKGNRKAREEAQWAMSSSSNFNVVITTYEFVVRDLNVLGRHVWQYIIIDEGHRMKNAKCKLATTLGVKYRSRNRLLLTGTPLQNNLTELWALLNFLLPSIFSSADTFEQWFQRPFETRTLGDTAELEEEETLLVINRLHQVLRPFLLRRLKTDVETQLPEKTESVINCDMSKWQRVLYRQVKNKVGLAMGEHGSTRSFNNLLMQCKKICNHPYLFYDEDAIMNLEQDLLIRSSGKFHLLQHMIPKLKASGHRTLIFSQMTAALDYLEDFLSLIGIKYMRLDGGTKSEIRQEMLEEFNAPDSPYFCFLLSTRAGGLGLNLQTADTVIIFDSDWNPMMDLQAQDRAHRIGQKNAVRVFRLVTGNTVEDLILKRANEKLQIDAQVIQAGQFNNKSTETDQRQMLKNLLSNAKDDLDTNEIPNLEELNRIVARNEEEFDMFTELDKKREDEEPYKKLIDEESELPSWVLQPEVERKTAEEIQQEILLTHGRGRRKRTQIKDFDQLTEKEWMDVMQGKATAEEVFERRRKRDSRVRKNIDFDDSEVDDDVVMDDAGGEDSEADEEMRQNGKRRRRTQSPRKRRRVSRRPPTTRKRRNSSQVVLNDTDESEQEQSSPNVSEDDADADDEAHSTPPPRPIRRGRGRPKTRTNSVSSQSPSPDFRSRERTRKDKMPSCIMRLRLKPDVELPPRHPSSPPRKHAHQPNGNTNMQVDDDDSDVAMPERKDANGVHVGDTNGVDSNSTEPEPARFKK